MAVVLFASFVGLLAAVSAGLATGSLLIAVACYMFVGTVSAIGLALTLAARQVSVPARTEKRIFAGE